MKEPTLLQMQQLQEEIQEATPYPLLSVETFVELTFDLSGEESPPDKSELELLGINFSIDTVNKTLKIWVKADEEDEIISVLSEE